MLPWRAVIISIAYLDEHSFPSCKKRNSLANADFNKKLYLLSIIIRGLLWPSAYFLLTSLKSVHSGWQSGVKVIVFLASTYCAHWHAPTTLSQRIYGIFERAMFFSIPEAWTVCKNWFQFKILDFQNHDTRFTVSECIFDVCNRNHRIAIEILCECYYIHNLLFLWAVIHVRDVKSAKWGIFGRA